MKKEKIENKFPIEKEILTEELLSIDFDTFDTKHITNPTRKNISNKKKRLGNSYENKRPIYEKR